MTDGVVKGPPNCFGQAGQPNVVYTTFYQPISGVGVSHCVTANPRMIQLRSQAVNGFTKSFNGPGEALGAVGRRKGVVAPTPAAQLPRDEGHPRGGVGVGVEVRDVDALGAVDHVNAARPAAVHVVAAAAIDAQEERRAGERGRVFFVRGVVGAHAILRNPARGRGSAPGHFAVESPDSGRCFVSYTTHASTIILLALAKRIVNNAAGTDDRER